MSAVSAAEKEREKAAYTDTERRKKMIKTAIVEDDDMTADSLSEMLGWFGEEHGIAIRVTRYSEGSDFIAHYRQQFDIVLMDIELPDSNGMELAGKLRLSDPYTIIIFVTNLAQYAVKGYEVDALDFAVKPVTYPMLAMKMQRALGRLQMRAGQAEREIKVKDGERVLRIRQADLTYVEVQGHRVIVHTTNATYRIRGTLGGLEKELDATGFQRCNNCYLVNLAHVSSVEGHTVTVGGDRLQISQPRRKAFIRALNAYICGDAGGE